jgi:hypothetical protein
MRACDGVAITDQQSQIEPAPIVRQAGLERRFVPQNEPGERAG